MTIMTKKHSCVSIKVRHDYSLNSLQKLGTVMIGEARWILDAMRNYHALYYVLGTNDGYLSVCYCPQPTIVPSRNVEIRGSNDKEPWAEIPFKKDQWEYSPDYLPTVEGSNDNSETPEMLALERRVMNNPYVVSKIGSGYQKECGAHKNFVDFTKSA